MEITRFIDIPCEDLTLSEKIEFIEECIRYLHERLEEEELDPAMRAIGFIGTTGTVAAAWSMIALGMVSPLVAIPGAIVVGGSAIASAISLATDYIQAPEVTRLQKKLISILQSKEALQWAKLWEEVGTDNFVKRLQYAATGSFNNKGQFLHMTGRHPFDVAVMFGGGVRKPSVGSQTRLTAIEAQIVEERPLGEAISSPSEQLEQLVQQKDDSSNGIPSDRTPQASQPATLSDLEQALEILDALVKSRRSTLLIGDTGAGKSVTQSYVVSKLFENSPNADIYVLTQKADSFCGLAEKGRVTLFDPTEPEEALALISRIWKIYDKRRRLPESDRPTLHPVRLILADWLSINQALEDMKNEEEVKNSKYLTKLADIIYNGRELNVCLLVDLQSYNLAAVGLKADRNSRKNFNLIGLGNYSVDELGMVNESYGVLINLIGDRYIVADESERAALNATFKELQPISRANQRPIIFSGLSPARLALLPDLRKYKTSTVSSSKSSETQKTTEKLEDETSHGIRERLELLIEATPKSKTPPQSEIGNKLLEIIQSATKYPISFESIRKSRKWEDTPPDTYTLKAELRELEREWIKGNDITGYHLQD